MSNLINRLGGSADFISTTFHGTIDHFIIGTCGMASSPHLIFTNCLSGSVSDLINRLGSSADFISATCHRAVDHFIIGTCGMASSSYLIFTNYLSGSVRDFINGLLFSAEFFTAGRAIYNRFIRAFRMTSRSYLILAYCRSGRMRNLIRGFLFSAEFCIASVYRAIYHFVIGACFGTGSRYFILTCCLTAGVIYCRKRLGTTVTTSRAGISLVSGCYTSRCLISSLRVGVLSNIVFTTSITLVVVIRVHITVRSLVNLSTALSTFFPVFGIANLPIAVVVINRKHP